MLVGLVAAPPALFATPGPPTKDSLRAAGLAGGPIEVRTPAPTGALGFVVVIDGVLVAEGVLVLGVVVPEVPADASCFVGDFVGDYQQC